jgi:hypothetical protein
MCFSASASFAAGTALLAIGAVTVKKAGHGAELAYAAIPLLFGVQQLIEGMVWLSFSSEEPMLNSVVTFVYSLFSHVLWPIYVPFAVLLLEPVRWRRRALAAFLVAGAAVGLYLLVNMFRFPIESRAAAGHIEYVSPHFYVVAVMAGYFAATCISMLFSSQKLVNFFGAAALLSFALAYAIYRQWFISVWCFFAALLSVIVLLHFTNRSSPKESSHGMAV